jgi:hypothetical protein
MVKFAENYMDILGNWYQEQPFGKQIMYRQYKEICISL